MSLGKVESHVLLLQGQKYACEAFFGHVAHVCETALACYQLQGTS